HVRAGQRLKPGDSVFGELALDHANLVPYCDWCWRSRPEFAIQICQSRFTSSSSSSGGPSSSSSSCSRGNAQRVVYRVETNDDGAGRIALASGDNSTSNTTTSRTPATSSNQVVKLRPCPRCKLSWYCGKECQAAAFHHGGHREECRLLCGGGTTSTNGGQHSSSSSSKVLAQDEDNALNTANRRLACRLRARFREEKDDDDKKTLKYA
ncbi:unnamed protein product, partial [Amoebophrya sp. A25]